MSWSPWSDEPYAKYLKAARSAGREVTMSVESSIERQMDRLRSDGSADVHAVVGVVEDLGATFEWGFSEVLASMGRMNDTLAALLEANTRKDWTKACEKFADARNCFRRGLYKEALGYVEEAISKYNIEWRFHLLKGTIQLGSFENRDPDLLNAAEAEAAFLLAARYARDQDRKQAARALLAGGWAAFIQAQDDPEKLEDALRHTKAANGIDPLIGTFQMSKILMALDRVDEGLRQLRIAAREDLNYLNQAKRDPDFSRHEAETATLILEISEALRASRRQELQQRRIHVMERLSDFTDLRDGASVDLDSAGRDLEQMNIDALGKFDAGKVGERELAAARLSIQERLDQAGRDLGVLDREERSYRSRPLEVAEAWLRVGAFIVVGAIVWPGVPLYVAMQEPRSIGALPFLCLGHPCLGLPCAIAVSALLGSWIGEAMAGGCHRALDRAREAIRARNTPRRGELVAESERLHAALQRLH